MLYYNWVDISAGIDYPKNNSNEECMVCHYRF